MMIHFDGEAKPTGGIVGEYSQPWATLKNNCSVGGSDGEIIGYIASYNSEQAAASQPNNTTYLSGNYYHTSASAKAVGKVDDEYSWKNASWSSSCIQSFGVGSINSSLNTWAANNTTSSVTYATWKNGSYGRPELDLGELENK